MQSAPTGIWADVNTQLGPEMKSTGEVLGVGKTLDEAIYKGFVSAGFNLKTPTSTNEVGVFISVEDHDYFEIVGLAKKLDDLGMKLYATSGTAAAISQLGIDVTTVANLKEDAHALLESGKIGYIVYTGALLDDTIEEFIALHRKAIQLSIATLTSLDTANAMPWKRSSM